MFIPSWFFPAECEWPLLCPYKGSPCPRLSIIYVGNPVRLGYFPRKPERPTACLFYRGGN